MSADRDLQNSYREWRRLAEAEGEAIRAGNWMLVFDCQNVLRQLQPRIVRQRLAREELAKLEQASLTLRRIQRSYLPPNSARWISFS
jgi:hypothetical protein